MRWVGLVLVAVVAIYALIWLTSGPQIDPTKVVKLDDLLPIALNCLIYDDPDPRGWPSSPSERQYIRFLQDHDCRLAFEPGERGQHFAVIGLVDSTRIRGLYDDAKASGIAVPKAALSSSMNP